MGLLLASVPTDAREKIHDHDDVHVYVDAQESIVIAGNVVVEVDVVVDVDGSAASLTFIARTSRRYLVGLLFASLPTDAREKVHDHDDVHVYVDAQESIVTAGNVVVEVDVVVDVDGSAASLTFIVRTS